MQKVKYKKVNLPCRVELAFFAVSLNLCLCLKSSPMVDFCQGVQQNDRRKSKGSLFFSNKYIKNAFGGPLTWCSCHNP